MTIENNRLTSEQVILPERYEELTVASMLPGETTYVTPWALWFDEEGKGWITGESALNAQPGGTVELWLARVDNGFVADISGLSNIRWRRQKMPSGTGSTIEGSMPVVALITNSNERDIVEEHLRGIGR